MARGHSGAMARGMSGTGASTGAGTGASERVEIVTRGEGRRSFSAEEKVRLVAETFQPGETVTAVSRRHGICTSLAAGPHRRAHALVLGAAEPGLNVTPTAARAEEQRL